MVRGDGAGEAVGLAGREGRRATTFPLPVRAAPLHRSQPTWTP